MKNACARQEDLLQRLLGEETVGTPTPEDLRHGEECAECRKVLARLPEMEPAVHEHYAALRASTPPFRFDMGALEPAPGLWSTVSNALGNLMSPGFALTFACLLLAVGLSIAVAFRSPSNRAGGDIDEPAPGTELARVSGIQTNLVGPDGGAVPLGDGSRRVAEGAVLELVQADSQARVEFAGAGNCSLSGQGQVALTPKGFRVTEGWFIADFGKSPAGYRVEVPGALLAIRGTRIRFELAGGTGRLTLLDGAVTVTPTGRSPFAWSPGEQLSIKATGIEREAGPADGIPPSGEGSPATTGFPTATGVSPAPVSSGTSNLNGF